MDAGGNLTGLPRSAPPWSVPFPMPEEMFQAVQRIMASVEQQTQNDLPTQQPSDQEEEEEEEEVPSKPTHSLWMSPAAVIDANNEQYDDVLQADAAKIHVMDSLAMQQLVDPHARFFAPEYLSGIRAEAKKLVEKQPQLTATSSAPVTPAAQSNGSVFSDLMHIQQQQHVLQRQQQQQQMLQLQRSRQAQAATRGNVVTSGANNNMADSKESSASPTNGAKRPRSRIGMVPKQKIPRGEVWECRVCKKDVKPNKMREHVGSHIMDDGGSSPDACGFCGRSGTCAVTLVKGSAKHIQVTFSQCDYFYKFNLKSALKDSSPCSNVPYQCPACLELEKKVVYIWKYNMRSHLRHRHPRYSASADFLALMNVTSEEKSRLKQQGFATGVGNDYDDED